VCGSVCDLEQKERGNCVYVTLCWLLLCTQPLMHIHPQLTRALSHWMAVSMWSNLKQLLELQ